MWSRASAVSVTIRWSLGTRSSTPAAICFFRFGAGNNSITRCGSPPSSESRSILMIVGWSSDVATLSSCSSSFRWPASFAIDGTITLTATFLRAFVSSPSHTWQYLPRPICWTSLTGPSCSGIAVMVGCGARVRTRSSSARHARGRSPRARAPAAAPSGPRRADCGRRAPLQAIPETAAPRRPTPASRR